MQNRRQFLIATTAASASLLARTVSAQEKKRTRIILLGTKGGPNLGKLRSNPSTLILIDDFPYLIDCGYGASRQLIAAGISLSHLRYVFITHHHSDHNLDYGSLLYNAWVAAQQTHI